MKILIKNYTFNKTAKTVTFNDYTSINLNSVLLVTNVTDNIIIYNFACPTLGGTVLNNVLTLTYETSGMDNADKLQIYYDSPTLTPSTSETTQPVFDEGNNLILRELLENTNIPLWYDPATGALKITGSGQTLSTVTTVGTVTTVTGQTNLGGLGADPIVPSMLNETWALCTRHFLT